MKLGGWTRIWIVICVLYAIPVALIASSGKPSLSYIHTQWISDASDIIADAISKNDGDYVSPYKVQDALLNKSTTENIAWLERIEKTPKVSQRIFSSEIGKLNKKYRQQVSDFPKQQAFYWLQAAAWWLGGCGFLYLVGWTIGWVARGFRKAAA